MFKSNSVKSVYGVSHHNKRPTKIFNDEHFRKKNPAFLVPDKEVPLGLILLRPPSRVLLKAVNFVRP